MKFNQSKKKQTLLNNQILPLFKLLVKLNSNNKINLNSSSNSLDSNRRKKNQRNNSLSQNKITFNQTQPKRNQNKKNLLMKNILASNAKPPASKDQEEESNAKNAKEQVKLAKRVNKSKSLMYYYKKD